MNRFRLIYNYIKTKQETIRNILSNVEKYYFDAFMYVSQSIIDGKEKDIIIPIGKPIEKKDDFVFVKNISSNEYNAEAYVFFYKKNLYYKHMIYAPLLFGKKN